MINNFIHGCDAMRTNNIIGMGFQIELRSFFVTIDQCSKPTSFSRKSCKYNIDTNSFDIHVWNFSKLKYRC